MLMCQAGERGKKKRLAVSPVCPGASTALGALGAPVLGEEADAGNVAEAVEFELGPSFGVTSGACASGRRFPASGRKI